MLFTPTLRGALPLLAACCLFPLLSFAQTCPDGVTVDGGTLALVTGGDSTSICAGDGVADSIDVALTDAVGDSSVYVITDADSVILALPAAPPFDLEGAGAGTCLIWHLSYNEGLDGAAVGNSATDLTGCFALSNPITVNREGVDAGTLALTTGGDSLTICAGDSISDAFDVTLSDSIVGANRAWVITDTSLNILGLPAAPPFDLEGAGPGICYVWYLVYGDSLGGAEEGLNAGGLTGCFDLSNPITVTRDTGSNCATVAVNNLLAEKQVTVFPNPVGDVLNLDLTDLTSGTTVIELSDINGRVVERRQQRSANGRHVIPLDGQPSGTYLLRVMNDGKSLTRRIVRQ